MPRLALLAIAAHHFPHPVELLAQTPPARIQHEHVRQNDDQEGRE